MFLISKNKILNYINEHPESRVSLALWLKYFESKPDLMFSGDRRIGLGSPNGRGSANTDNKYCIEFETNHPAKTQLITWIGTIFEQEEKRRKENEERERYFRDVLGEKLETKTVVLTGKCYKKNKTWQFNSNLQL